MYNRNGLAAALLKYKEVKNMFKKDGNNEIKTLAHSTYRCQYHIVFAPKYRRKEIYGTLKKDIGEILRKLCEQKGVEIIEAEACKDHMLSHVQFFATPWTIQSMESPSQNTGVDIHSLLQGILPTQESNPGLLHCRQILYQLSHHGSPYVPIFCFLIPYP